MKLVSEVKIYTHEGELLIPIKVANELLKASQSTEEVKTTINISNLNCTRECNCDCLEKLAKNLKEALKKM